MNPAREPLRVLFVQPVLAAYREPFFAELTNSQDMVVEVWADAHGFDGVSGVSTSRFAVQHRPAFLRYGVVWQPAVWEGVRSQTFDVVVLSWNVRFVHLFPALVWARLHGKPVVLWGHGYSKSETFVRRGLRDTLGHMADAIVTYGEKSRQRLLSDGFRPEKVFVARNTCAPEASRPGVDLPSDLGSPLLLYSSRLELNKRLDILLHAFVEVLDRYPKAELAIIGDGSARNDLQDLASQLGIEKKTRFLGAIYDDSIVGAWMRRAAMMPYPANIGLSIIHAFHYGLPVITSADPTKHGPEFEALRPGVNGEVFADGDAPSLANAILGVLDAPSHLDKLRRGALATVSEESGQYSLKSMASGMSAAIGYAFLAKQTRS